VLKKSLRHIKYTSPGTDNIQSWFFKNCSYEIAEIITHILNLSLCSGSIPHQCRSALVTLIPKVPKPIAISDYRPISVTPLLSRVAEELLVANWLRAAIPRDMIADQFGFRPTGSTDCALIFTMRHVSAMVENCEYVRCLVIDFSRAFDVINHVILLDKLSELNLPDYNVNWIVSFLTDRTQSVKVGDKISCQRFINRGIVQGSGVGPTFYVVMESDLKPLSSMNLLCKFADDTNLLWICECSL